jgi:hypothetical protein
MKKIWASVAAAMVMGATTAWAGNLGAFGSFWNQKDGDNVAGGGVVFKVARLVEVHGAYYEDSTVPGLGDLQAVPIDGGLSFDFANLDKINLVAGGGATYYLLDSDDVEVDDDWGWYALGRLELKGKRTAALFGEVLYRWAELDNVDLGGMTFNVGVLF